MFPIPLLPDDYSIPGGKGAIRKQKARSIEDLAFCFGRFDPNIRLQA